VGEFEAAHAGRGQHQLAAEMRADPQFPFLKSERRDFKLPAVCEPHAPERRVFVQRRLRSREPQHRHV
jgi:hypothetical protein